MQILLSLATAVDTLSDFYSRPPDLEACRPESCPLCGFLARRPGSTTLGIVGHGTYTRSVWGVADSIGELRKPLRVRRFLCRGCARTISALPDLLHPRRWYGAWVILEALILYLFCDASHSEIEWRFRGTLSQRGWRCLTRWRRELLSPLFGWWGRRLGARGSADSPDEGRRRLQRLLAQVSETTPGAGAGLRAAPRLLVGRAYARGVCWPRTQAAPESLRVEVLGE